MSLTYLFLYLYFITLIVVDCQLSSITVYFASLLLPGNWLITVRQRQSRTNERSRNDDDSGVHLMQAEEIAESTSSSTMVYPDSATTQFGNLNTNLTTACTILIDVCLKYLKRRCVVYEAFQQAQHKNDLSDI